MLSMCSGAPSDSKVEQQCVWQRCNRGLERHSGVTAKPLHHERQAKLHTILVRQSAFNWHRSEPCWASRGNPQREWATWNKRSLRRTRLTLFQAGGQDGQHLCFDKFGLQWGTSAGVRRRQENLSLAQSTLVGNSEGRGKPSAACETLQCIYGHRSSPTQRYSGEKAGQRSPWIDLHGNSSSQTISGERDCSDSLL